MDTYRRNTFSSFLDRSERKAKKHLKLLETILKKGGFDVTSFIEENLPYLHVKSTVPLSFNGIKVYMMNDGIAFRCQDEPSSSGFGKAYKIDIEEIYNDFLSEKSNINEEKAARQTAKSVVEELKNFFEKSKDAEATIKRATIEEPIDPIAGYASNKSFDANPRSNV